MNKEPHKGPFKPASVAELKAKRGVVHTDPIEIPDPNRRDSFWHSGDVAVVTYQCLATKERRRIILTVRGKIELAFVDDAQKVYRDDEAVHEAMSRGYTDVDLIEGDGGKVREWKSNNWFQLAFESSKWKGRVDIGVEECGEIFRDYNKGIEIAQDLITNDVRWEKLFP